MGSDYKKNYKRYHRPIDGSHKSTLLGSNDEYDDWQFGIHAMNLPIKFYFNLNNLESEDQKNLH